MRAVEKRVLDEMYACFVEIDRDGTGVVDLDEFYRYFELERSPFADRVFGIMDEDASGDITFREFGMCVWRVDNRASSWAPRCTSHAVLGVECAPCPCVMCSHLSVELL